MNVNHSQYLSSLRFVLGVALAVGLFATSAQAQSRFVGKFTLTNEVHWRKAVLPPGDYSLNLDIEQRIIVLSDAHTNKPLALEVVKIDSNARNRDSQLVVTMQGNQRVVTSARLAGFGEVFHSTHVPKPSRGATEEAILIHRTWTAGK
jgi:hypothetical protein